MPKYQKIIKKYHFLLKNHSLLSTFFDPLSEPLLRHFFLIKFWTLFLTLFQTSNLTLFWLFSTFFSFIQTFFTLISLFLRNFYIALTFFNFIKTSKTIEFIDFYRSLSTASYGIPYEKIQHFIKNLIRFNESYTTLIKLTFIIFKTFLFKKSSTILKFGLLSRARESTHYAHAHYAYAHYALTHYAHAHYALAHYVHIYYAHILWRR